MDVSDKRNEESVINEDFFSRMKKGKMIKHAKRAASLGGKVFRIGALVLVFSCHFNHPSYEELSRTWLGR